MLRNSKGETIIEVTMAIAVLAVTVVMAFATANESSRTGIQAKEHIQAIHLAAQQADRLKIRRDQDAVANPNTATNILGSGSAFMTCGTSTLATCYIDPSLVVTNAKQSCPAAVFPNGTNCFVWFQLEVVNSNVPSKAHYTAHVQWDSMNGYKNDVAVDMILVDKRGFRPRDCSEADLCTSP